MKTIGIIGAMPSELVDIRELLGKGDIDSQSAFEFHINHMDDKRIVSVCCGIGKVNAAVCTQTLISLYNADCIINAGIAGGMDEKVKVCDIVISKDVMHHDLLSRFLDNYPPFNSNFKADEKLIEIAESSCKIHGYNSFTERIVSGEMFISDNELKASIKKEFNPYAVDMESSAVGHCAFLNKIPFVTIRCISDNADDEGEMSFEQFEKIAAKRVSDVAYSIIKSI